ncbi:MAG TPA: glycosyltransferase [Nitrospirae bacterium]|nr:glycosyltransferase [Nitrospirota bacterium]
MKISFIIISGGSRVESMERLLRSIEKQGLPDAETVVIGDIKGLFGEGIILINEPQLARTAAICKMRNIGVEKSSGSVVVLLDDDMELTDGWYAAIKKRLSGDDWDIAGCRVTGPSGGRWYDWNWASREDPLCPPRMIEYGQTSENLYISGCLMIIRRHVFDKVRFNENLLNHQRDDVDFCHRAIGSGFKFECWPEAVAVHHLEPEGRSASDPGSGSSGFAKAVYMFRKGAFSEALTLFHELAPSAQVLYHLCLALKEMGMLEEAAREFKKLLKALNANDPKERRFYYSANFHLGVIREQEGKPEEAQLHYRETLAGFPEHYKAALGLSRMASAGSAP